MADVNTANEEMNEVENAGQKIDNLADAALSSVAEDMAANAIAENSNNQDNNSGSTDLDNSNDSQNIDSQNTDGQNNDSQNLQSEGNEGNVDNQSNQNTAAENNKPDSEKDDKKEEEKKDENNDDKKDEKSSSSDESKKELSKPENKSEAAEKLGKSAEQGSENANKLASIQENAREGIQNGLQNIAEGAGSKLTDGAINVLGGGDVNVSGQGEDGAEVVNKMQEMMKKGLKLIVDMARAAAGDVSAMARLALKAIKLAIILFLAIFILPVLIVFIIVECIGSAIGNGLAKLSEALPSLEDVIPPYFKAETEFTMEQQYEVIAKAFGDGVQRAYQEMMEDINNEIEDYNDGKKAGYEDINEWDEIINYNLSKGRFKGKYTTDNKDASGVMIPGAEVSSFDNVVIRDEEHDYTLSLPSKAGDAIMPYIGGYSEAIPNSDFTSGYGWKGRLDKGLWALNKDASTPASSRYATGKEGWFNSEKSKEGLSDTIAYQAVSDMAYLVAGYNVSMMEDTIFEMGEKVSKLQLDISAIKYEIDIASRIFQQQLGNAKSLFGSGNWIQAAKELINGVFQQDTYFNYDPDEISVSTSTATRMVLKYKDYGTKDIYGSKYKSTINVTYKYQCTTNHGEKTIHTHNSAECNQKWPCGAITKPGEVHYAHPSDPGGCTIYTHATWSCSKPTTEKINHGGPGMACSTDGYIHGSGNITAYFTIPASDILASYNPDGTIDTTKQPKITDSKYSASKNAAITNRVNEWLSSISSKPGFSKTYTAGSWTLVGNDSTSKLKAIFGDYIPTEVSYTESKLDIPMSPFDCDKMMKMLFETSPYYTEITKYYTDEELSYNVVSTTDNKNISGYNPKQIDGSDDEVLEYYGRYIAEWKYCYFDNHEIDYSGYPAGTVTYNKGDIYDNGIDSQPYFTLDEVYLYDCNCDPHFGMATKCPLCGAEIVRSNKIGKDAGNAAATGDRPVSAMYNPMMGVDAYFGYLNSLINFITGVNPMDAIRANNQKIKENEMMVKTTFDKTVLDNYTGDQVGGNIGPKPGAIEVVLTKTLDNGKTRDYYPITVEDRVLELKDSMLNILENTDYIQGFYSAIGLSYGNMLSGEGGAYIDGSGVDDYVLKLQNFSSSDYSHIDTSGDKTGIGIGNFIDADASEIINAGINNNPSIFPTSDGLTKEQFLANWGKLAKPSTMQPGVSSTSVRNALKQVLESSQEKQNELYKKKVQETVKYLMDTCQVTDPATLCYLSNIVVHMKLNNVSDIGKAGDLSTFRNDVILTGIAAGADKSLDATKQAFDKWATKQMAKGNKYVSSNLVSVSNSSYTKIAADKEAGELPWIIGGVAPEDVQQIVDFAIQLCKIANTSNTVYGWGFGKYPAERMTNKRCWDAMEQLVSTGHGLVSTDCSAFVQALFWKLGYTVPGTSMAWVAGNHQYRARTDFGNMIPGDVIVWGNTSSGHVELYIGNNQSLGFGSAPPKIHNPYNTNYYVTHYGAVRYYRVVSK